MANASEGYKSLQKTKWLTLAGCTLAVGSSTLMYLNVLLYFTIKEGSFASNPWLNPLVFAISLDSILNDVGMLLVSGVPKNMPSPSVVFSGWTVHTSGNPRPAPLNANGELIIDSQAYERDSVGLPSQS